MTSTQRFFKAILPRAWFASAEAESRRWLMQCPCGAGRSVWDAGGIRWKAAGKPRRLMRCGTCGGLSWHTLEKVPEAAAATIP